MDLGSPAGVLTLVHALSGIAFLVGLVGRWIVLGLAARAADVASMRTLTAAAAPFERVVIVGSLGVLGLGVATAVALWRPFLGPLQGAGVDWLFVAVVLFLSIVPLVPLVFVPRGRVFAAALAEATASGEVTPGLRAAWTDPIVRAAHLYELGASTLILVLMLAKPF